MTVQTISEADICLSMVDVAHDSTRNMYNVVVLNVVLRSWYEIRFTKICF